jgi:hypothetical protein
MVVKLRAMVLVVAGMTALACNRRDSLPSRCALVEAILAHRSRLRDGFRPAITEDSQCASVVSWRGRPVVRANEGERPFFSSGEACDAFWMEAAVPKEAGPPEFAVFVELVARGPEYRWEYWVNSREEPSRTTCAPNEGKAMRSSGGRGWRTED